MALAEFVRNFLKPSETEPDSLYGLGRLFDDDYPIKSLYRWGFDSQNIRASQNLPEPPQEWVIMFERLDVSSKRAFSAAFGYALRGDIQTVGEIRKMDYFSLAMTPTTSHRTIGMSNAVILKNLF